MGTTLSFEAPSIDRILDWKPFIKSQNWFENEIILLSGAKQGRYNANNLPHVKRIFQEIDKLSVVVITLMTSSQTSKTTIGIGSILKYIDTEPNDALIMFPRDNELSKMYDNKVKKLIDGCSSLSAKLEISQQEEKKKSRAFGLNILGIILNIVATNNTKSVSTKFNYYDEVAEFPPGKLEEAMERGKTFDGTGEKFFITSTQHATKDGDDDINHYFNISELKLQYWANCPHCNEHFYPEPSTLVYPTLDEWQKDLGFSLEEIEEGKRIFKILSDYVSYSRERASIQCPYCSHKMSNKERRKQILDEKFQWFAVEPDKIDEQGHILSWKKTEDIKTEYRSVGFDVNTLCVESYDIGNIVAELIAAEYSNSKIAKMQMCYVGQFNRIYRTNIKKRDASDILMITNGLPYWIVPKNSAKLYLLIDTQKDHYWWKLASVEYGKIYHVVAHGKAENKQALKDLMFQGYKTEDNKTKWIDRATIDMRGYQREEIIGEEGEIVQTRINTTENIREFIIEVNKEARQNGLIKPDEHLLFGTMGKPRLDISEKELEEAQKRGESPTGSLYKIKTIEDKVNPSLTYKIIFISNLAAKTELFSAINNNIENFKLKEQDLEPNITTDLFYINEDMRQEGLSRIEFVRNEDYERMMTAEVFNYDMKNGKLQPYKTFIPLRKRNDQLDNAATLIVNAAIDNIGILQFEKPKPSGYDIFKKLQK